MNKNSATIGVALALVLAGALGSAEAKERHLRLSFSGTSVNGVIDTNKDGFTATVDEGVEKSTVGKLIFKLEDELLPPLSAPVTCPKKEDTLEFPLLQAHGVKIHEKTGDQFFFEYTSGTICLDTKTLTFSFSGKANITGGTGKFEGASGSFDAQSTGTVLVLDSEGHFFSVFHGTATGTLITP